MKFVVLILLLLTYAPACEHRVLQVRWRFCVEEGWYFCISSISGCRTVTERFMVYSPFAFCMMLVCLS